MENNRLDAWISQVKSSTPSNISGKTDQAVNTKSDQKQQNSNQEKKKSRFFFRKNHPHKPQHEYSAPIHQQYSAPARGKLRAIPLGGLNEVGRNCMAFEYENDIIIVDAGVQFPEEGMYGIDFILPDTRYVEQKKKNIRAIIITHGHLDHIGGIAHLLPKLGFPPVYAPPLATGLIKRQLEEYKLVDKSNIIRIDPSKDVLKFGAFTVEYFHVNHSIPDCTGLYIQTPAAKVVHTGDFKFDFTPADGVQADYAKIAQIGARGVDTVFADSTNAQKDGFCVSEKVVAETLERLIQNTTRGRLFITSFASLLGRWQQVIRFAQKYNRKVYVTGRSLLENLRIANDMGFIKVPQGLIHKVSKRIHDTPPHQQLIISTGCQGEENAGMARIVRGDHDILKIEKGDTVVFSASPIPGNERQTINLINELYKLGGNVVTRNHFDVHTSGHGHQGDLKLMYALLKPKNIVPVHGEFHMRADHAKMVQDDLGYKPENTALLDNGEILEIHHGQIQKLRERVPGARIMIDGKMTGDIGDDLQKERKALMNGGVISFVLHVDHQKKQLKNVPHVSSLGFAYPQESRELHTKLRHEAMQMANEMIARQGDPKQREAQIRRDLSERLSGKILQLTEREPQVLISLLFD